MVGDRQGQAGDDGVEDEKGRQKELNIAVAR